MGQWVAQNTTFLPSVVKERGVWHATNVTCPYVLHGLPKSLYRFSSTQLRCSPLSSRRFHRTETIPCRYLCFLNDIWQKRLRFCNEVSVGFLEVISRRLLLEIRRRRFRAPAATCYDSERSLLPRSFSGLKLFFRSPDLFLIWQCFLRVCTLYVKNKLDIY